MFNLFMHKEILNSKFMSMFKVYGHKKFTSLDGVVNNQVSPLNGKLNLNLRNHRVGFGARGGAVGLRQCATSRKVAGSIPDNIILPVALWPWS